MARFNFKLESVLQQRQWLEREKQRAVAEIAAELVVLEGQLRGMDEEVRKSNENLITNHLVGPVDANYLIAHRRYLNATQRRAVTLAQKMALIQQRLDAARAELIEAAKQRKIMEKLREKQKVRWLAEIERKEAVAADEAAIQFAFAELRSAGDEEF